MVQSPEGMDSAAGSPRCRGRVTVRKAGVLKLLQPNQQVAGAAGVQISSVMHNPSIVQAMSSVLSCGWVAVNLASH